MKDCAKAGFPFDKDGLIYSVKQIVSESKMQTPFKRNIPGNKWYHSYIWWPQPENPVSNCPQMVN
ncbi:unnamed protein product [Tenebrio molitor]|nr:unnamed protein product [Tenebrio molitor]